MVAAIATLSFACVFALVYWIASPSEEALSVSRRLSDLRRDERRRTDPRQRAEMLLPFRQRVVVPIISSVYQGLGRLAPGRMMHRMTGRLEKAGKPFDAGRLLAFKLLCTCAMPLWSFALVVWMGRRTPARWLPIGAALAALGYVLPDFHVSRVAAYRRSAVRAALPDALDLLTVSVEAGLGFDGAMKRVSERFKGPVSQEFREYLKEVRLGKPRADALRSMAARVEVDDLKTFAAAVIQAEQLGVSLARVLRVQSDQMRVRRKQRAEELAMQTPIKMVFPLVFFVFPAIFIVLLGPIVIHVLPVLGTRR